VRHRAFVDCDEQLRPAVESLLSMAGLTRDFRARLLDGGANNRVFHLRAGNADVLLKVYFRCPEDGRDRLAAEFAFCRFAWENGIHLVPRPLACMPEVSLALYEYLPGRPIQPSDISDAALSQALDFYDVINKYRGLPAAAVLPNAAEACFSIQDHLECVDGRVARLTKIEVCSEINESAHVFVRDELEPMWRDIRRFTVDTARAEHLLAKIAESDKCLSPSDFGFHNAVMMADGALRFIDFEYAGWDDPGKLVCDFFCQPALPVPLEHFEKVMMRVTTKLSAPDWHRHRIRLLFPVYQIKWCCILLNDFLSVGSHRRLFSGGLHDVVARKVKQLQKARTALTTVRSGLSRTSRQSCD